MRKIYVAETPHSTRYFATKTLAIKWLGEHGYVESHMEDMYRREIPEIWKQLFPSQKHKPVYASIKEADLN